MSMPNYYRGADVLKWLNEPKVTSAPKSTPVNRLAVKPASVTAQHAQRTSTMATVSELDYQVSKDGIHEIWRREWENSAALRREFRGDMESFVAFKAAELQGRVRIVAPKAGVYSTP